MSKPITIIIKGGLVEDAKGVPEGYHIRVIDYDTEGADGWELTIYKGDLVFMTEIEGTKEK